MVGTQMAQKYLNNLFRKLDFAKRRGIKSASFFIKIHLRHLRSEKPGILGKQMEMDSALMSTFALL